MFVRGLGWGTVAVFLPFLLAWVLLLLWPAWISLGLLAFISLIVPSIGYALKSSW